MRRWLINVGIALSFLLLPLALYGEVTLGRQTMLPADNLYQWEPWANRAAEFGVAVPDNALLSDLIIQNYAWKQFLRQSVANGELPLWNPYLFGGAPFLATGQNQGYYPLTGLFLLLPLPQAYGWYTVVHLWLAGVFMYILGRILGQRRASAALSGLVYQGCGFMVVSAAVFPMIIGAAVWLPLILAALEMIVRCNTNSRGAGHTLPWAVLGAVALGMQTLAGHIEITYYSLIVMAFYALWRLLSRLGSRQWRRAHHLRGVPLWRGRTRRYLLKAVMWLSISVLIGLMLGAIQLLPFYEVGSTNFREGSATLAEVRGWGFPVRRVLTFGIPDFFGSPTDHAVRDVWTGEVVPLTTNYYGDLNPHGAYSTNWGIKNYVEGGVYLGLLTLFLAGLGVVSVIKKPQAKPARFGSRRSAVFFFVTLSTLCLAFVFGTPLYAILYYGFPGLNQLHSPFRWVFPLSLAVAALAGFGMDYLADTRRAPQTTGQKTWASDRRPAPWIRPLVLWGQPSLITGLAGALFWGGTLGVLALHGSRLAYPALAPTIEQIFLGLAQAPDAFPDGRTFYSYQFANGQLLGLMLILAGIVLRVSRCPIYWPTWLATEERLPLWPSLAALVVAVDLLVVGYGFNASADPALLEYQPALVQWLGQQPEADLWRLTSFDNKGSKPFNANTAWLTGFQDVRGYDSIIAKQYVQYMQAIEPQNELGFNRIQPLGDWQAINSPLLDLLGVKYIITQETLDLPKLTLAWSGDNLRVYENVAAVPRAYTIAQSATVLAENGTALEVMQALDPRQHVIVEIDDWTTAPADRQPIPNISLARTAPSALQPATVHHYSGREVIVAVTAEQPVWLVLNDTYFPGWRVFVRPADGDERERTIVRVNHNFRGVQLQPGEWEVRFRYSPASFLLGGLTSLMAAITLLFGGLVWGWRRYYRPQGALTNTSSIAKNSVVPMTLNLFNRGIDFLFAAYYLRLLGPVAAGNYATAIAIAGLFEIVANFGLNAFLIREVSQAKERASSYLLNSTILRLGTGALSSLPILLYLQVTDYGPETAAAILFLMGGMVLSGMSLGTTGLFYAHEEAEVPAAITTVTTIMKVGLGVVVLLLGFGFVGLAAISIVVNLITLAILLTAALRRYPLRGPWRVDWGLQRAMLTQSYPLMLNHLLATIYWQVDVLLLREINGEAAVGWYNSAYKYINAFNIIPSFLTFALFPILARQVQSALDDARRTFSMSAKLLTLVSLPLAAVVTLLAPVMIGLLGGQAFLPHGAIALQIVVWSIPFGWLNSVTNYVLISLGQERLQTRAFLIGVGFNVGGNLLLLPALSYVGAGLTTIASEIILLLIFNYYLRRKMPQIAWGQLLWRPVAVTVVMLALMLALAQWNLWLALLAGLLVYPLGLWGSKAIGHEERQILQAILPAALAQRLRLA